LLVPLLRRLEDVQARRAVQASAPASQSREIVWKILVVHGKICYHRGIRVAG